MPKSTIDKGSKTQSSRRLTASVFTAVYPLPPARPPSGQGTEASPGSRRSLRGLGMGGRVGTRPPPEGSGRGLHLSPEASKGLSAEFRIHFPRNDTIGKGPPGGRPPSGQGTEASSGNR
eukprot:scaffold1831_cov242-Pavlova_lutheri.AAC.1